MKTNQLAVRRDRRARIDDSPEAVEARMGAFVQRTRGWGARAINAKLPEKVVVLAGPTRANPRLKRIK
jgi:hypothetical protein